MPRLIYVPTGRNLSGQKPDCREVKEEGESQWVSLGRQSFLQNTNIGDLGGEKGRKKGNKKGHPNKRPFENASGKKGRAGGLRRIKENLVRQLSNGAAHT